jgi:ribose transport system permease protein
MTIGFGILNPRYLSVATASNILQDFGPILLIAIGSTFVIVAGGIDLSPGAVLGLSGMITAIVAKAGNDVGLPSALSLTLAVVAGLAIGALVGLVNGLLSTRLGLAPFIATLATMGAAYGSTLVISDGLQIAGGPPEVLTIGNNYVFGFFTAPVAATFLLTGISWVALAQTRFGRYTYAIGSNTFAARVAGVRVERHLVKLYIISGLLAAAAGIFVYFRLSAGAPASGRGGELQAIAAVVIGGTSLFGGKGRLGGTIIGALIIASVLSGLIMVGVPPAWQQIVTGGLIAVSVAIQVASHRGRGD